MFDTRKEQFREYSVPTPDSRPTGIVVDDKMGLIWFIETEGNKLARLDPRDGKIREFALPTSFEAPGDLAIDISGSLWFGGNKSRILMAFDPKTEKFETFPVPKRGVTEGLAAGFDGKIVCSFKNFGSIGVFDPATRKLMEVNLGSSKSKPKDIAIDAKGDIWFADLGMNALFWLDGKMVPKLWLK
jgi:virginiamycin B lyase